MAQQAINTATGTRATSGDGTAVIAAPGASSRILIDYIQLQSEAGEVTILLKHGSTSIDRIYCAAAGNGKTEYLPVPVTTDLNSAIYVNLSDAVQVGYVIRYRIQST